MAPGLNGRQTGTLPKNKGNSNGSQSQRHSREAFSQSSSFDWEPMSDVGSKKLSHNKSSTHSEAECDSVQSDVRRSRSSTMTSQNENEEDYPQNGLPGKIKTSDRKHVVNKLSQIQSYLQQTADLMNAIKTSESSCNESGDSRQMQKFARIISENYGPIMCTSNGENSSVPTVEEELSRKSEESRKKLEALQKRKQDLLKLQDKAKKQLQEAQAEQSRLVARAASLNQELSSGKLMDLNVQHLNERLKAVQKLYKTRNQIAESLIDNRKENRGDRVESLDEEQSQELSDPETDYQLVADKMEELNTMKVQLGEIQKMMASINGIQNGEIGQHFRESNDDGKDHLHHNIQHSHGYERNEDAEDEHNAHMIKLEQAKSKLNQLTQLLDIVQTAQNANNLPSPYLQIVTDMVNEETNSTTRSPSPSGSGASPPKNRNEISLEAMQVMTRELEDTTAAMKIERNKLEHARQELQNVSKKLPLAKSRGEALSPNDDSGSEPPCLKSAGFESSFRDILNICAPNDAENTPKCNDNERKGGGEPCLSKRLSFRNLRQQHQGNEMWNASSNSSTHERQSKNGSLSRSSNLSSRNGSRTIVRESRWSPAPSVTYCSERSNPAVQQIQNQLEISSNLCEMALSESGIRPCEISLQAMFSQHQLLTRTVAQCSQLLWLQQKQIIELRNAIMLQSGILPNFNLQQMYLPQSQSNVPGIGNLPYAGFFNAGMPFSNANSCFSLPFQPPHNYQPGNGKLNLRDNQSVNNQEPAYSDQINSCLNQQHQQHPIIGSANFSVPDQLDYDIRGGNFNRLNLPVSNQNANLIPGLNTLTGRAQQPSSLVPDHLDYDLRRGNFNLRSLPVSNQNPSANVTSGSNIISSRAPNGLNCPSSDEAAAALNNQVPPGNRANNYWDNFRSYSRQNLLSNPKSNEGTDTSRRTFSGTSLDRLFRDHPLPLQSNQWGLPPSQMSHHHQHLSLNGHHGNSESGADDHIALPSSQNGEVMRCRLAESQGHRNSVRKNESRHLENDSRLTSKNEGAVRGSSGSGIVSSTSGARSRCSDRGSENIRNVRNDVNLSLRADNLNSSRNCVQSLREGNSNADVTQGINKKRLERSRGRVEGSGNLNNRDCYNTSLWENISFEVSRFIRSNESRPLFLMQLFQDLRQVTTDSLRQRTLESIAETVITTNNLVQRTPINATGGNVNVIENRNNHSNHNNNNNHHQHNNNNNNSSNNNNNARENRSNLNRTQGDDAATIDELFCQLRENQNTIRQNIGMGSFVLGGNNLENPNISNIRDLVNSRNNLGNEGLRDLRTFYETNLCNFGGNHSTLENPNLSNIKENLTRRLPSSEIENMNPKNVYLSIYDNAAVETRRRNLEQESSIGVNDAVDPFRNFEVSNEYLLRLRTGNNQLELGGYEGEIEGRSYLQENDAASASRFPLTGGGDNFVNSRQFLPSVNDSGIDINYTNEERKRSFPEGESTRDEGGVKPKKNDGLGVPAGNGGIVLPQWHRNSGRDGSFDSPPFISICDNSFFNCRSFRHLNNGDLAEADQSRNDETSGAESDTGFMLSRMGEPETDYDPGRSLQSSDSNFSGQNVPESERNFQLEFAGNESEADGANGLEGAAGFPNSASEPEGNFPRASGSSENLRKSETSEGYFYQLNAVGTSNSESGGSKHRMGADEMDKETLQPKKMRGKSSGSNKSADGSSRKFDGNSCGDSENQNGSATAASLLSHAGVSAGEEEGHRVENGESVLSESFPFALDENADEDKGNTSPEAEESDWECGSGGLDQVPTRLKKSGSSRKSDDSGGSIF